MIIFLEKILIYGLNLLMLTILIDALISFIPIKKEFIVLMWIKKISESVLKPIRKFMPETSIGFDFSPLIAIVIIKIIQETLIWMNRWFV